MGLIRFVPTNHRYHADLNVHRVGFDPDGPWQMVPYKGSRYLHLDAVGVSTWTLESVNPFIAEVSQVQQYGRVDQRQNNVYQVDGRHAGTTFLIARGPDREQLGKIEIEVKHRRKLFIRYFLVSDNAGHATTFSEKDTREWTDFINKEVFEPQINVGFEYLSTREIKIRENLKDRIDFEAIGLLPYVKREGEAGRVWHMITDAGMLNPNVFNVFCVWDFVNKSSIEGEEHAAFVASKVRLTADEMEKSGANYNMCMLRNTSPHHAKLHLAHEVGHYLNRFPAHTDRDDLLMTPGTGGTTLLKADARKMNPSSR